MATINKDMSAILTCVTTTETKQQHIPKSNVAEERTRQNRACQNARCVEGIMEEAVEVCFTMFEEFDDDLLEFVTRMRQF